ncbi:MAG: hypothetical protein PVG33_07140, partial [Chloroflexota bacterium]
MQDESPFRPAESDPLAQSIAVLRPELNGLFEVTDVVRQSSSPAIAFTGRFLAQPDAGYAQLYRRFQNHG